MLSSSSGALGLCICTLLIHLLLCTQVLASGSLKDEVGCLQKMEMVQRSL